MDIEWKPALAYVWRAWDETVSPDQLVDGGLHRRTRMFKIERLQCQNCGSWTTGKRTKS